MNIKQKIAVAFAKRVKKKLLIKSIQAEASQLGVLSYLLRNGEKTAFGIDHKLSKSDSYEDFKSKVPIYDYEDLKAYVEHVKGGTPNVLWPGTPKYLCKTSGTTSGAKFIPLTRESLKTQIRAARNALL